LGELVIGIDLGNHQLRLRHGAERHAHRHLQPERLRITPSVVAMARNGKRLVGALARRQAVTNAERTVVAVKRLMGRRWSAKTTQEAIQRMPYSVVAGPHDDVRITLGSSSTLPRKSRRWC